jgi:hypothetical protein
LLPIVVLVCVIADGPVLAGPSLELPEVSLGSSPYRSFAAYVDPGVTDSVLTVPDGQDFIVTMFKSEHVHFELVQDATVVLSGFVLERTSGVSTALGRARLRIEAGTTLSVRLPSGWWAGGNYFLQGYFVQAGSPYRSTFGATALTTPAMVFTADADRDFLVRTIGTSSYSCDVYIDGSKVIPGQSWAAMDPGTRGSFGGFAMGLGALVLPAGAALQLVARDGVTCSYYIDGEYLIP